MRSRSILAIAPAVCLAAAAAPAPAPAQWEVTVFRARAGYALESASHQAALDLIADRPWLNPMSGQIESPIARQVTVTAATVDFIDPDARGDEGTFAPSAPFPGETRGADDDHFALVAAGIVRIPRAGFYSFIVGHDDTFQLTLNGETVDSDGRPASGVCCNLARPVLSFALPAGDLPIRLSYGESEGGAYVELFAAEGQAVEHHEGGPYALVGDTAGGGLEVLPPTPCDDPPEVAVIDGLPATPVAAGAVVVLDGSASTTGGNPGELSYRWEVVSGPGSIDGPDDKAAARLELLGAGDVRVSLTVDDGVCRNPAAALGTITAERSAAPGWRVTFFKALPGYLLDENDHQRALDLIHDVPWRDPDSGETGSPIEFTAIEDVETIDYLDPDSPGDRGRFEPSRHFPADEIEVDDDHFALLAEGTLQVPLQGFYSFIVGHDDTFELSVDGFTTDATGKEARGGCCEAQAPVFTFELNAGEVPIVLTYGAAGGGAFVELFATPGFDVPYRDDSLYRLVGDTVQGGLEVVLPAAPEVTWIRGDANGDRTVDISDPVASLQFQFAAGPPSGCPAAQDSNRDGRVDISDPVHDLGVLFLGRPLPGTWLECERFAGCAVNCP